MHHQQDLHLVAPPPMYPMQTGRKAPKRSHDIQGKRTCFCFRRRPKKRISILRILSAKTRLLNFFSLYGIPYFLALQGLLTSVLCPLMGFVFINDCPAFPVLTPILLGKSVLGVLEFAILFFMTAEAFQLDKSVSWIGMINAKVNWRLMGGVLLSFFVVWYTVFLVSTNSHFVKDKTVSQDPTSPRYCHEVLYTFALICKYTIICIAGITVALFFVGSCFLLLLLGIVSRIE